MIKLFTYSRRLQNIFRRIRETVVFGGLQVTAHPNAVFCHGALVEAGPSLGSETDSGQARPARPLPQPPSPGTTAEGQLR